MTSYYSPRWAKPDDAQTHPRCDVQGCEEAGQYKAPRSRYSAQDRDYYHFCLEHVTEYNKKWNYFTGMSQMEIEDYWDHYDTDHRPTWKREQVGKNGYSAENLQYAFTRKFGDVFGEGEATIEEMAARIPPPNRKVEKALRIMQLQWPVTLQQVKQQFKVMVKKFHPDVNCEPMAEERFKRITEAHRQLKEALKEDNNR